jgi:hypothetical protein
VADSKEDRMLRHIAWTAVLTLSLGLAACARKAADAPAAAAGGTAAPVAGQANREGTFLAYEHTVALRLAADRIAPRVASVREACMTERFGGCVVLGEEQSAGEFPHGQLQLRAAPAAIGKLVDLAADGAEIAQRSTTAEDLAQAVRDNGLRQRRLRLQYERLSELAGKREAKLEELLTLNERLAGLEAELQQAEQEAAQQQRRLDTNLLTLRFDAIGVTAESSATGRALRSLGGIWDNSVAVLVQVVGALLPFLAFGVIVWLVVRGVLRVLRRRSTS